MDTMVYNSSANNWATLTLCVWKYNIKQNPLLGLPLCYSYVMQWPFKQYNINNSIFEKKPLSVKKGSFCVNKKLFYLHTYKFKNVSIE